MLKKIPIILLIILPYALACVHLMDTDQSTLNIRRFLWNATCLINIVYPFLLSKLGFSTRETFFWNAVTKITGLPYYVLTFLGCAFLSLAPFGRGIIIWWFCTNVGMLVAATMYGISGIVMLRKDKKIPIWVALLNVVLQGVLFLDCVSAVYCYRKAKKDDNISKIY